MTDCIAAIATSVSKPPMRIDERKVTMIRSTYWQYSVSITQDGRRDKGIVCGGKPTFIATIAEAITQASYYVSLEYTDVTIDLKEICALCEGTGQVFKAKKRGFSVRKTCPDCKGNSVANRVGPIPIKLCLSR